jgi:TnpA family transposase
MLTIYTGKTRASQLIRKLSAFSRKHPLFKAFRNIGRILRTKHILELAGDKEFRRRIYQELNKGESKNSLAGDLRYGRKGTLRYRDPEMQLCAISATNLAILCISICNSIDMQNGIRKLRNKGHIINLEDLRFFSPYFHHKHNLYGNFFFHSIPDTHQDSIENAFIPLEE